MEIFLRLNKTGYKLIFLIGVFILLNTPIIYAQSDSFSKVVSAFNEKDYQQVKKELIKIDTTKLSNYNSATWFYYHADYKYKIDEHHKAYESIIKSKNKFKKLNKKSDVTDCNFLLIGILSHQNDLDINTESIIKEITDDVKKSKNINVLGDVYKRIAIEFVHLKNRKKSNLFFNKVIEIAKKQNNPLKAARIHNNIGISFNTIKPINLDSALYYFKKSEPIFKKYKKQNFLVSNFNNQGISYKLKRKYKKAIAYFNKADSIPLNEFKSKTKLVIYKNKFETFRLYVDFKNASIYYEKYIKLKDSINDTKQNIAITEIKEKYDNDNERSKNLKLNTKMKTILPILVIISTLLAIVFILYKKYYKKAEILEEEKSETIKKIDELKQIVIKNHIILKDKTKVYIADLLYIKSDDHYLKIFLSNGKNHFVRGRLNKIIEELPPNFIRCHRSYVVNRNFIKQINNTNIILVDKTEIPLSRSFKDKL